MGQNLKINFFKISQNKKNVKILKMGQNFENSLKFKKNQNLKSVKMGQNFEN